MRYSQTDDRLINFYKELLLMSGAEGRLQTYAKENKKSEELISNRIQEAIENEECAPKYHQLDCVGAQS